jgi:hypothetical protein
MKMLEIGLDFIEEQAAEELAAKHDCKITNRYDIQGITEVTFQGTKANIEALTKAYDPDEFEFLITLATEL